MHALQEAPRASWTVLGSALRTDPRTIARTYSGLVDSGTFRLMAIPGRRLLEYVQWGQLRVRTSPGRAEMVAAQLARWPQATTVRVTDGSSDVHALVLGTDHRTLLRTVHDTMATLPAVESAALCTALRTVDIGRAGRLDSLSRRQVDALRAVRPSNSRAAPVRLTVGDFDIISALMIDGRMEISELARRLDREPSTVSRRVSRLYADGYVDFLALTVDSASSHPVVAFLWCTAEPAELDELIRRLPGQPWLGSFTITSGATNTCIAAHLPVPASLPHVLKQLASLSPSLKVAETQIASHAVKLNAHWLDDNDRFTDNILDPYLALASQIVTKFSRSFTSESS